MAISKTLQLEERVRAIRAEIDAFIDARAEAEAKECPGVPLGVIRNSIARAGCQCSTYLELKAKDELERQA
ncbi:hypothetical protein [Bradyrhizobium erythrophlei]|uniref:Uncharacterized protein n=1 Tax=Bradyrhizobium erythrophlei TaxID=1437360 RepID=A0A1H4NHS3_9BRAD|nr:hypothetical protein [Bradyrhizobium erythrophlei]SEB94766.1 hypothetical protein SAMN05444164_0634 [Bradyrhizobium erythrophlei]